MNSKTHRPCLILVIAMACGIIVGKILLWPLWCWIVLTGIFLSIYFWRKSQFIIYVLVLLVGALIVTQRNLLPANSLAFLSYGNAIHCEQIEGMVVSDEEMVVQVNKIFVHGAWMEVSGSVKIRIWGQREFPYSYGQVVRIKGKMYPIYDIRQGSFSYRRYLQERGIFWMFSPSKNGVEGFGPNKGNIIVANAQKTRKQIKNILNQYLQPREVAFVAALLIGDRRNFPKDLKEIFVNTGTAHILAISGMNMAIIVTVFFFIFQLTWIPRKWKYIMTVVFLFAYAYLSGWSASVVRATIMSAVLLSSFVFEYEGDALNSLGVAALILFILNPNNVFDVGFQLSFAAVAGILTLTKPFENFLKLLPQWLALAIAVSTAAFIVTAPIIAYHFHLVTPISVLANLPIVPLADLVMVLGLGLVAVGTFPALALTFAGCLKAVLSAMILCASWFSQVPGGCWQF